MSVCMFTLFKILVFAKHMPVNIFDTKQERQNYHVATLHLDDVICCCAWAGCWCEVLPQWHTPDCLKTGPHHKLILGQCSPPVWRQAQPLPSNADISIMAAWLHLIATH